MAGEINVERLTPLDWIVPRTYLRVLLTFRTATCPEASAQKFETALHSTWRQIPWMSGRVVPVTSATTQKPTLEIHWKTSDGPPVLQDLGSIPVAYQALALQGMPPDAFPEAIWPVRGFIDEDLHNAGAPVFAASLFRFADNGGVGLVICTHHNVTDAGGLDEIVRLLLQNVAEPGRSMSVSGERFNRLFEALSPDLEVADSKSLEDLLAAHPEYSMAPPVFPPEFPSCTSRVFSIPSTRIEDQKDLLQKYTAVNPTTNTVICALLWTVITQIRMRRSTNLSPGATSRLAMAVNGRQRISPQFSTPENPYFGNVILYSLAELSMGDLAARSSEETARELAKTCDAIATSSSPAKIDSRHIAETYSLISRVEDHRAIFIGWDPFSGRDLTITSWANLGLYDADFGAELGKPEFVRLASAEADGVSIILPRRRGTRDGPSCSVIEVTIMLRKDDMEALERDDLWRSLTASNS
ncbi:hypothetical protein AYO20_00535 [Fonsecaea nubica]|uniref:Uncharacterized protein n=1 Tax=Fonsecaea nubica TaxID=856822 RepID=A0A178DEK9_9EURO|nr:hypothetical protein AYO20_00535 [Fonsecaea nubica]OAL40117.1 hypothetical protein AYO20_00535 [Fonsecaea nubica]